MRTATLTALLVCMLGLGCNRDPEPSCVVLQDYYDDCCFTCGAADSYCTFYDLEQTEGYCAAEIVAFGDLGTCFCDE